MARRQVAAAARAVAARRARAAAQELYKAELAYQARVAPYVAEQQFRQAQLDAQVQSDQARLRLERQRNLIYAYGLGAPISAGSQGLQVYDGFADYGLGRP
jgi:hypothetical protein